MRGSTLNATRRSALDGICPSDRKWLPQIAFLKVDQLTGLESPRDGAASELGCSRGAGVQTGAKRKRHAFRLAFQ
jgi:hypothetical protein